MARRAIRGYRVEQVVDGRGYVVVGSAAIDSGGLIKLTARIGGKDVHLLLIAHSGDPSVEIPDDAGGANGR
jgi:hypothetical protein